MNSPITFQAGTAPDEPAHPGDSQVPLVLVVDDEPAMLRIVSFALRTQGFRTISATGTADAEQHLSSGNVDLVILDVMLPHESGIDLCRRIRATTDIPVILLTARGEADDRVAGLEAGADDYVVKPFSPRELALRAEAVLRRARPVPMPDVVRVGALEVDRTAMRVSLAGRPTNLSAIEYRVLGVLVDNLGATVRWQDLYEQVWRTKPLRGARAMLKTTMHRLRSRIGDDPSHPTYIITIRGVGYRLIGHKDAR